MIIQRRNGRIIHGVGLQRAWAPHRDPSCLCAFDADPGYYVRNGTGVSRWNDVSGHGYHALQPTALNQPAWIESDPDFRGHGSLTFNGTSSFLYVASIPVPMPFTWYAVVKWGTGGANAKAVFDAYGASGRQTLYSAATTGRVSGFSGTAPIGETVDTRGTVSVAVFVVNGASSAVYNNSVTAAASGDSGSNAMTALCIGALTSNLNFMEGKMAAIFGFSGAHTSGLRGRITKYLGGKYGKVIS